MDEAAIPSSARPPASLSPPTRESAGSGPPGVAGMQVSSATAGRGGHQQVPTGPPQVSPDKGMVLTIAILSLAFVISQDVVASSYGSLYQPRVSTSSSGGGNGGGQDYDDSPQGAASAATVPILKAQLKVSSSQDDY